MKIIATTLIALAAMVTVACAQPSLGTDCGTGATITGTNTAGKVTIGTSVNGATPTCTLTFAATDNNRECFATNETVGGATHGSMPEGVIHVDGVTEEIDCQNARCFDSDVVNYGCVNR